jgi:hypothetical protein
VDEQRGLALLALRLVAGSVRGDRDAESLLVGPAAQDVFVLREPLEYPKWLTLGKTKSLPLGL